MRGFRAMVTGLSALLALVAMGVALVALPGAARAQSYPTGVTAGTIGERVPGHVSLQCDSGITACTPPTTANPVPVSVVSGDIATAWTYTSGTAGILNNTTVAVTVKAAAGASLRNYIDSCQINTTAFGAAAPLAFRDGAGGAVIWALNVPSAGFLNSMPAVFDTPLRSTANTLIEVVTTSANVTGTAYVNCQGHSGP